MIEEDRGSGQCFGQLLQPVLEGSFSDGLAFTQLTLEHRQVFFLCHRLLGSISWV